MNEPLVTVYITNHNYGRFIKQAIESVLKQTFRDFELIIIDDGSTDDSWKIIESYNDPPRVITVFQHNKGLTVTNNIALRLARGRYIVRLDADDYLDENALMVLSGVMERSPDIGLVFPDYFLVDEAGNILELVRRHDFNEVTLLNQPAHGACTMIRKKCLLEVGGYDESFRYHDGYELWIKFIEHYRVQNVNLPLFYYRQHPKSITRNEKAVLEMRSRIIAKKTQLEGRHLKAIAVIPARGTATDPCSHIFRPLGGKPLVDWTIDTTLGSIRLSNVIVTTPDEKLLAHVSDKYADRVIPIKREPRLALFNSPIEKVLFPTLEEYASKYPKPDIVVVLYIESPFRTAGHIDSAINIMELFDTDSVIAVRADTDNFYRHNGHGLISLRKDESLRLEREELYRQVGHIHVVRHSFFEKHKRIIGGKIGHITFDEQAAFMIRSEEDWEIAEIKARKFIVENKQKETKYELLETQKDLDNC